VWFRAREIKKKYLQFFKFANYSSAISDLQKDEKVPCFTSNLVYLTKADTTTDIESKIIYSILNKFPKRADKYWFLHVNYTDEPSGMGYFVTKLIPDVVYRIDFNIGFRVSPKINIFFRKVIEDLINSKEVDIVSHFPSLKKHHIPGDFKFVLIDRIHTFDIDLKFSDRFIMSLHEVINKIGISESNAFGLDTSVVIDEKVPLHNKRVAPVKLYRIK
jgi:KUP system potassium uptake protein